MFWDWLADSGCGAIKRVTESVEHFWNWLGVLRLWRFVLTSKSHADSGEDLAALGDSGFQGYLGLEGPA
jgi:hypothetical protein